MKKLSILVLGLLLVSGFAFAQYDVAVDGEASVTWGVDLNTSNTGFVNAASSSVTITLVPEATAVTGGDDGLYGEITVEDYSIDVSDSGVVGAPGSVTALIFVDPATITIYSEPDFAMDMAPTIDSGVVEGDISSDFTSANTLGGITISVPAGPATVDVKVASDGDWTDNGANDYGFGVDVSLDVAPATVDLGFIYGYLGAPILGISAGVELDVAPATITLGFDGVQPDGGTFDWDLAAGASVAIADENEDGDASNIGVDTYIYTGGVETDLDVVVGFTEFEVGGLVDMLYATVDVEILDVLATLAWNLDVAGGYNTGDVEPYFGFGYGSDEIFDLNAGVILKEGMTGIDNTTVTLDYVSTDLSTDSGIITIETSISL